MVLQIRVVAAVFAAVSAASAPFQTDTLSAANMSPQEGHAAAARDAFETLLRREPANSAAQDGEVRASEQLALEARSSKDMKSALETLLRAQRFAPENTRLLYDLGVLEEEMGLYLDADTTVTHLRKLSGDESRVMYLASRVKLDLGRLNEAEQNMRAYLNAHPEDASAHYGLGRIFQQAQQPEAAKAEFEKAIALMPTQTESYYQVAQIDLEAGKYKEAIDENKQVLARNPHHGGALVGTGIAYFKLKQYAEAGQFLSQAVTDAPEYQPAHYYYGLVLARLNKPEQSNYELTIATKMAAEQNKNEAQHLRLAR